MTATMHEGESHAVPTVHTRFDCKHEKDIILSIEDDVEIPESVRGLGKCPDCTGGGNLTAVGGIAPRPGGKVVLDSIMMMPIEG
jgi:hypothetical protein